MSSINRHLFESLVDRADTAASSSGERKNLLHWIQKNTRDPKNNNKQFSTTGHEFQEEIINDQATHVVVQKPAQRGVSEIFVRMVLALAARLSGSHFIYVLPTAKFAGKFATSRMDPVIDSSPRLKQMVSKDINNSETKKIGSSFVWIGGAQSDAQAISIPARGLFVDEASFGDPAVLSIYKSRLGHNTADELILYEYSTPLFPGFGISESFDRGTQKYYMTYHTACGTWVVINSLIDIVVPGFDDELVKLTYEESKQIQVRVEDSWVKCPHCGRPVTQENMADPRFRAWVPKYPERRIQSYQVDALDMAARKFAPDIIGALDIYKRTDVWIQFGLGYPHSSSDTSITLEAIEAAFTIQLLPPEVTSVYGATAGMDVGNISHLSHARRINGVLEFFNLEIIRQDGTNSLGETFVKRYLGYRCYQGVIDAGPDVSVCKFAQEKLPGNRCWAARFVRGRGVTLDLYVRKEEEGVLNVMRTAALNEFVAAFNSGKIKLPRGLPFEADVRKQLAQPKRVTHPDALGEESSVWVSTGADHWFFSIFYNWLASKMLENDSMQVYLGPTELVGKTRLGGGVSAQRR